MPDLAERYARVKATLPAGVKLVAVSKTRSVDEIRALYDLGQRAFGENYPQELREKAPQLPSDIEWHFIGHLQRSNVKHVLPLAHLVHGVDSESLLDEIDKRAVARPAEVLLQVHIAQEETKHGFLVPEIQTLWSGAALDQRWPRIRFRGLMGMATNTTDTQTIVGEFRRLKGLFDEMQGPIGFDTLSMGMSGDAPLAIAEGSTLIRIGSAIFGARS
ncbi:MAG TPA: YggS family pyridoxal phosphate-dependent enzyme [Flavobacteriales bacterium]